MLSAKTVAKLGAQVVTANDGREAVDAVRQRAALTGQPFDLVLMDYQVRGPPSGAVVLEFAWDGVALAGSPPVGVRARDGTTAAPSTMEPGPGEIRAAARTALPLTARPREYCRLLPRRARRAARCSAS